MPLTLATVNLPYPTGLPRDVAQNTFWFSSAIASSVDTATEIMAFLGLFYGTSTAGESIAENISNYVVRDNVTVDFHSVTGAPGGPYAYAPFDESGTHLELESPAGGLPLPLEVALVLTVGGPAADIEGVPAASRRGRVYVGPLNTTLSSDADERPDPQAYLINAITGGATAALDSLDATAIDLAWVVFSRKLGSMTPITGGWVDNEWDTQRRRGADASARTNWSHS